MESKFRTGLIKTLRREGSFELARAYCLLSALASGKGWCDRQEFSSRLALSRSSFHRRLRQLENVHLKLGLKSPLVKRAGDRLVVPSKHRIGEFEAYRISFSMETLSDARDFKEQFVLQVALIAQERNRRGHRQTIREKSSYRILDLKVLPEVEINPDKLKGKVGVAFSKIAEATGLSKSHAHSLIRKHQTKQRLILKSVSYYLYKKAWAGVVAKECKLTCQYFKKSKRVCIWYALSSTYSTSLRNYSKRRPLHQA